MIDFTRYVSALVLAFMLLVTACQPTAHEEPVNRQPATVLYLVRHAEKLPATEENPDDPSLSEEGHTRARQLAQTLHAADVTRIYSSDFARTRETAQPLADTLGLPVEVYDARALQSFAEELKTQTGRIVVVGHSNTTPALAEMLGGEAGEPIDEEEYDRFYVLVKGQMDGITTLSLRYGNPFAAN